MVVALGVVAALVLYLPTGQYAILPGITEDLTKIVTVHGGTKPAHGRLMMVAVSVESANWFAVLSAPLNPAEELVPQQEIVPTGASFQEYVQYSYQQMDQSQSAAAAAAFRVLGMKVRTVPTGVTVFTVESGGPSAPVLRAGDRILSVDGKTTLTAQAVQKAVGSLRPGTRATLTIARGAHRFVTHVKLGTRPGSKTAGFLGVGVVGTPRFVLPRKVTIKTSKIGGPSAGMMFALEVVAQFRPVAAFPDHQVVAGTGTITADGKVGAIGGIQEKVITASRAGANLFLAPAGNANAALEIKRRLHLRIRVVPVSTLAQALVAVHYTPPSTAA